MSNRLKLLFYIPGLVDGGAERVVATLASQYASTGHQVLLVVDFAARENSPPVDPRVRIIQLPAGHKASLQKLARLMVMLSPDICLAAIASCNFKLATASLMAKAHGLLNRGPKPPRLNLILTYHGFEEYKTGKLSWLGYVSLPIISRIAKRVVAVSDALKLELRHRWKAKKNNLVRIYNPVSHPTAPDGAPAEPTASLLLERENIVLCLGRLVPDKRFDLVIRAFALVDDPTASLIILGEGPERSTLQCLIDELGLQQHVTLQGFHPDTGAFYARAKCFVLASRKESFGLVLVEALGHGLPVISSDCGGPREVLGDGKFGVLLAPHPTPDELATAINKALQDPGDPAPRFKRAKIFSLENGTKQYTDLFAEILQETT